MTDQFKQHQPTNIIILVTNFILLLFIILYSIIILLSFYLFYTAAARKIEKYIYYFKQTIYNEVQPSTSRR